MRPLLIVLAVAVSSCNRSNSCRDMHFERFGAADRAVITVDSRPVGEIKSPTTLRKLADFAQLHASGWSYPWFGPPVAHLYLDFFAGQRFLGDFGVGPHFLSAQGCDYFQSRPVNSSDRRKLIELVGVGDPDARVGQ